MDVPTAGRCARFGSALVALAVCVLALTGCSSDIPTLAASPRPAFTTMDQVTTALACRTVDKSMSGETDGLKGIQTCYLGHGDADPVVQVFEFTDKAQEDSILTSQDFSGSTFLILGDTLAVNGPADNIIAAHAKLKTGEIEAGPTPEDEPDDPSTEDSTPQPATVREGKAATTETEQVKITTIHCPVGQKVVDATFCRLTNLGPIAQNPDWGDSKKDPNYKLPEKIDVKAPAGNEFFNVAIRWKNIGQKPTSASDFGTLVTANGTEYDANEWGNVLTEDSPVNKDLSVSGNFNPGTGFRMLVSYTIPKGTHVIGVHWGTDDADNPLYTMQVS